MSKFREYVKSVPILIKPIRFIRRSIRLFVLGVKLRTEINRLMKSIRNFEKHTSNSSASDNGRYPFICYLAATNENIFSRFRQSVLYTQILEHVSG